MLVLPINEEVASMLGDNIRTLRRERGLTQETLAAKLNVVRQTVSKWEKGLSVPDAELLQRLAEVLEVSVSQLLGGNMRSGGQDRNEIAEQLAQINEQLAIRNRRGHRIWKTIGIVLLSLMIAFILLIVLGLGLFTVRTTNQGSVEGPEYADAAD